MISLRQGAVRYLALLFGMLAGLSCANDADATTFTVHLRPGEPVTFEDFFVCAMGGNASVGGIEFRKEPDFGKHSIIRGVLESDASTSHVVGFALDMAGHKMCIDQNANQDLIDDPDSPYEVRPGQ